MKEIPNSQQSKDNSKNRYHYDISLLWGEPISYKSDDRDNNGKDSRDYKENERIANCPNYNRRYGHAKCTWGSIKPESALLAIGIVRRMLHVAVRAGIHD
jgi:hypothetical protein